MWTEQLKNGKVKFVEEFKNPMTGKFQKISVTLEKATPKYQRMAQDILREKKNTILACEKHSNLTFKELVDKYTAYQYKTVKLSTYKRNLSCCNTLKGILGENILVEKINARYIREKLLETNRSNHTLNELLKRLKALLRWGYKNDYIENISYLAKVELFKDDTPHERVTDKYLEEDEMKLLINSIEKANHPLWLYVTKFLILTGMRIGEMIALTNEDIDLKNRIIHIHLNYDINNGIVTTPKNSWSVRDIYIQDELLSLLRNYEAYKKLNKIKNTLYFPYHNSYVDYDNYRMFLKRHSKKSIKRAITPHTLRHTHASMLMANGMSIEAISRRLGHANSKVTREIYLHVIEKLREKENSQIKEISIF